MFCLRCLYNLFLNLHLFCQLLPSVILEFYLMQAISFCRGQDKLFSCSVVAGSSNPAVLHIRTCEVKLLSLKVCVAFQMNILFCSCWSPGTNFEFLEMQVLLRALREWISEQPLIINKYYCLLKHTYWANESTEYKGYSDVFFWS